MEERRNPDMLSQNRRRRIAAGSGRPLADVHKLIKQFKQSRELMGKMSKGKMPKGLDKLMGGSGGKKGGMLKRMASKIPGMGGGQMPDMSQLEEMAGQQGSQKPKRKKKKKVRRKR